jgi:hypothetical protein
MSKDPPTGPQSWRKAHKAISWSGAGKDSLHSVIAGITDSGNALMFSRTIDGSALVLSVYSGDTKSKEYVTEPGDIPALLAWALETYS